MVTPDRVVDEMSSDLKGSLAKPAHGLDLPYLIEFEGTSEL